MRTLFLLLALAACATAAAPPTTPFDPVSAYAEQKLRGWTLRVNKTLLDRKHDDLRAKTLELLDDHLYRITRMIPAPALTKLRAVPIWIELAHPRHPCMCYHPSGQWLREHGMNPKKAGCVEIANVHNFLTWTREQPWMVLHELAHAYHHQVLKFDHPEVKACYDEAMRDKRYAHVLHINGSRQKHYACTNPMEYFAEMTEAYFGTNDFYPFVRAELLQADPRMHALLEKLWGVKKPRPARPR